MLVQLLDKDDYPHIFNTDYIVAVKPESPMFTSIISYSIWHNPDNTGYANSSIHFKSIEQATAELQKLLLPC